MREISSLPMYLQVEKIPLVEIRPQISQQLVAFLGANKGWGQVGTFALVEPGTNMAAISWYFESILIGHNPPIRWTSLPHYFHPTVIRFKLWQEKNAGAQN